MNKLNLFPEDIEDIFAGIHNEFKLVRARYMNSEEILVVKQNKTNNIYRIEYIIDDLNGRFRNIICKLIDNEET